MGKKIRDYSIVVSERNPWNKLVSSFFWKLHHSPAQLGVGLNKPAALQQAFKNFVLSPVEDPCDAFSMYSHEWMPLADHVIRFEHFKDEFSSTSKALGLPADVLLPVRHAKSGIRPSNSNLAFDEEMENAVRLRFAQEIAAFGYDSAESKGKPYSPSPCQAAWKKRFFRLHEQAGWRSAPSVHRELGGNVIT